MLNAADLKDISQIARLPDRVSLPNPTREFYAVDLADLSLGQFDEYCQSAVGRLDDLTSTNAASVNEKQIYEAAKFLQDSMGWDPPPAGLLLFTLDCIWLNSALPKPRELITQCLEAVAALEHEGVSKAPLQSAVIYKALRDLECFKNSARQWIGHYVDSPGCYLRYNDRPAVAKDFCLREQELNEWLNRTQAVDLSATPRVAEKALETTTLSPGALSALSRFCLVSIQLHNDSLKQLLDIFSKFIAPAIEQSTQHLTISATCGTRFYHHLRTEMLKDPKVQRDFAELYNSLCDKASEAGQEPTEKNYSVMRARALAQALLYHHDVASAAFTKLTPLYQDLLSFVELAVQNNGLTNLFLTFAGEPPYSADHDLQVLALLRDKRFCSFFDKVESLFGLEISELRFIFEGRSVEDQMWLCRVIEALLDNEKFYCTALSASTKKLPQATLDFISVLERTSPSERQKVLALLNYFAEYAGSRGSMDSSTTIARFIAESVRAQDRLPTVEQWTVYKTVLESFGLPTPAQVKALFSNFPPQGSGDENQRARVQGCTGMVIEHDLTEEAFFLILERAPISYIVEDGNALARLVTQLLQRRVPTQLISRLVNGELSPSDILARGLPKKANSLTRWIEDLCSPSTRDRDRGIFRIFSSLQEPLSNLGALIYERAATSDSEWMKGMSQRGLLGKRIKQCAKVDTKPERALKRFGMLLGELQENLEFQKLVEDDARFERELLPALQQTKSVFLKSIDISFSDFN